MSVSLRIVSRPARGLLLTVQIAGDSMAAITLVVFEVTTTMPMTSAV